MKLVIILVQLIFLNLVEINENSLNIILKRNKSQNSKDLAILFYIPACPHCMKFLPIFKKVNDSNNKNIKFYRINIDKNRKTIDRFKIKTVPHLVYIHKGVISKVAVSENIKNYSNLNKWINKHYRKNNNSNKNRRSINQRVIKDSKFNFKLK